MEIKTLFMRKHAYSRKLIDLCRFVMHRTLRESLEYIKKNGINHKQHEFKRKTNSV